MFNRITIDPNICSGKAIIKGQRITVDLILKMLSEGSAVEDILSDYPTLEKEDILEAIKYGAWLASERGLVVP